VRPGRPAYSGALTPSLEPLCRRPSSLPRAPLPVAGPASVAADGELMGYIGAAVDMTEHRRAEQEARQHRDEIAHVSRVATLGELAASSPTS
jgi:PAS domain-containing protein